MLAVDTNVIVRYLTGDDPKQAAEARALIGEQPVFVGRTVLLEVEWVLRGAYHFAGPRIIAALRALGGLPGVTVEDAGLVAKALDWAGRGLDFADALHLAGAVECSGFVTFDQRFAKAARRLDVVPVVI